MIFGRKMFFNHYLFGLIKIVISSNNQSYFYQNPTVNVLPVVDSHQNIFYFIRNLNNFPSNRWNLSSISNQSIPDAQFQPNLMHPVSHNMHSVSHNMHPVSHNMHPVSYSMHPHGVLYNSFPTILSQNASGNIIPSGNHIGTFYQPNPLLPSFYCRPFLTLLATNLTNTGNPNSTAELSHTHGASVVQINDEIEIVTEPTTEVTTSQEDITPCHTRFSSEQEDSDLQINVTQDSSTESEIIDIDLDSCDDLNSGLPGISGAEPHYVTLNEESLEMIRNTNENIPEVFPLETSSIDKTNANIETIPKFIATADNSELLYSMSLSDRKKIYSKAKKSYFKELSMTRFKLTKTHFLPKLRIMQREYETILTSLEKASIGLHHESETFCSIISKNLTDSLRRKSAVKADDAKSQRALIILNMSNVCINIFSKNKIINPENELDSQNSEFSVDELKHIFSQEKKNLKEGKTDIPEVLEICSYFVNYESKLFGDMDRIMIAESLEVLKITETFSRLKKCMETNIVYEILVFINLYEKNLVQIVKKHHVVSTVFLLNAICFCLDRIKSNRFLYTHYEKKYPNSRFLFSTEIFYAGQLFEKLLRNLEDHEMKADCYGLLNCCRYFLKVNGYNRTRNALYIIQIPSLIAIVMDKSFSFNEKQLKELASFALYFMKTKEYKVPDFYNDKIEYFAQQNETLLDNVSKTFNFFITEYQKKLEEKDKYNSSRAEIENIFKSATASKKSLNKKPQLKDIYFWQLYWNVVLFNKALAFYTFHHNICETAKNAQKTIELYYNSSK